MKNQSDIMKAQVKKPKDLPPDWKIVKLGEICRPRQWPTVSSDQMSEDGYPVFGANGWVGFYPEFNHEFDTLAITCRGATCGTINWIPGKSYITGNSMCLDELKTDIIDQRFLYFALTHRNVSDIISGSAQPQIVKQGVELVDIPLPPLPEQLKITETLLTWNNAIELAENKLKNFRLQKQGLMQKLMTGKVRVKV